MSLRDTKKEAKRKSKEDAKQARKISEQQEREAKRAEKALLNQELLDARNSGDTQTAQQIESELSTYMQQLTGPLETQTTPEPSFLSKLFGALTGGTGSSGGPSISIPKSSGAPGSTSGQNVYLPSQAGTASGSPWLLLAGIGILAAFMLSNRR